MTSLPDRGAPPPSDPLPSSSSREGDATVASSSSSASEEQKKDNGSKQGKASLLSSVFNIFEADQGSSSAALCGNRSHASGSYAWSRVLRRILGDGSMWHFLGCGKALTSDDVWFLGKCYKLSSEKSSSDSDSESAHAAFLEDFSSRIWVTYIKGFDAISDSKFTSDVNWSCMVRSSQMLVAQALIFHYLGRSWRKLPSQNPCNPEYIRILHLFGDSEACAFSIHNLLEAGKSYGLAAGSWVGPYAMCRAWQTLIRINMGHSLQHTLTVSNLARQCE